MPIQPNPITPASPARDMLAQASLLAGAIILSTLVTCQVLRLFSGPGLESTALAGLVSEAGGVTMLTVEANSDELVFVVDNRAEELMVYKADNNQTLDMLQKYNVPELFSAAKARVGGP